MKKFLSIRTLLVIFSVTSLVLLTSSCSENSLECNDSLENSVSMIGKHIDTIKDECGNHVNSQSNSGLKKYTYKLENKGKYGARLITVFSVSDTVRQVSTLRRYFAEKLEDGENLKEYDPPNKRYEEIVSNTSGIDNLKRRKGGENILREGVLREKVWEEKDNSDNAKYERRKLVVAYMVISFNTKNEDGRGPDRLDKSWNETGYVVAYKNDVL